MKKLYLLAMALIAIVTVQATPQARDVLYWNGNKYSTIPNIDIEKRMNACELNKLNLAKTANPPTSNYRGYSLELEIVNDTLYLIAIKDTEYTDLTKIVFGSLSKKPLLDFSDTLYLGYGDSFYDHAWWTMVYESEMTVVFKNGVVKWVKDNKNKSKYSPYTYDIQLLQSFIYSNIRWNELDKKILQTKPVVYLSYEIDSVEQIKEAKIIRSSGYAEFDKEAARVIKAVPGFSISFVEGRYIHHPYTYRIIFDIKEARKLGVNTTRGCKKSLR